MFYKNHKNKVKSISATSIGIYILLGLLSIIGIGIGIHKLFSNNSLKNDNNSNSLKNDNNSNSLKNDNNSNSLKNDNNSNSLKNDNIKSCKINNDINLNDPINIIHNKLKKNDIHVENKNISKLYNVIENIKNDKNNLYENDKDLLKAIQLSLDSYQQENLRNPSNISLKKNYKNNSFLENRRLINFGVICYSNTLMQAMYSCENLKNFLLQNIQQSNNQNLQYIKNVFEYFDSNENVNDPNLYELDKPENYNYFITFFNTLPKIQLYEQQSIIELYDKILEEVSNQTNIKYKIRIDNNNNNIYQNNNVFGYNYINYPKNTFLKNNWLIAVLDLHDNTKNITKRTEVKYIVDDNNTNINYELKSICLKSGNGSYGHYICIDSNDVIYNDNYNEKINGIFDKVCKDGFYDRYNIEVLFYNANLTS